jgi:CBS domain-containing protein
MKVREIMTLDVLTVGPDASLKEAARLMLDASISGLPVTTVDGLLVGIITEADFVSAEASRRPKKRARLLRFLNKDYEIPSQERLVDDVMTTEVVTISSGVDHACAARLMEKEGIKRIPVVDDDVLVGLVSRSDMLKAFNRPDHQIVSEIEDHLMREVLWIDSSRVRVRCEEGNVALSGRLETRSDVALLVSMTKRLDGVVSVAYHLTFEVDDARVEMVGPAVGVHRRLI